MLMTNLEEALVHHKVQEVHNSAWEDHLGIDHLVDLVDMVVERSL